MTLAVDSVDELGRRPHRGARAGNRRRVATERCHPSTSRAQAQDEHRAATSTLTHAHSPLPPSLAGVTEAEIGDAIAAAAFSVLARAHCLTTALQISSTAPPASPPPPSPVA
jgi:hypothetical protein